MIKYGHLFMNASMQREKTKKTNTKNTRFYSTAPAVTPPLDNACIETTPIGTQPGISDPSPADKPPRRSSTRTNNGANGGEEFWNVLSGMNKSGAAKHGGDNVGRFYIISYLFDMGSIGQGLHFTIWDEAWDNTLVIRIALI